MRLAKEVQEAEKAREEKVCPVQKFEELEAAWAVMKTITPDADRSNTGIGSTIFAVKPGTARREQAASCQKVLGGWANIANEYATKRYRSNLINWGMLPFLIKEGELPFKKSRLYLHSGHQEGCGGEYRSDQGIRRGQRFG